MIDQSAPPKSVARAPSWDQRWIAAAICLALAVMTLIVFGRTTGFGFVNFDDDLYVYQNTNVAGGLSLKGAVQVFAHADCSLYHPLTMLSLMADHQLYGLRAGGYHFTNIVLHTASVVLLFLVLWQMTGALWRSAFVAAVFAIHPLRVESVAWVTERKDVLATFFFMVTLGAYVFYARAPKIFRYALVLVAFVCALLSKPTVVTLPFVLLLLDYWPLRRPESARRLVLEKLPLLALAAAGCVATMLAAKKEIAAGAVAPVLSRLGNALVSYAVYLRQMVWPTGLAVFYPRPEKGFSPWTIALSFLVLALVTAAVLAFGRKRRWLLTGWLWYLGMLTPMSGIKPVGGFAYADRMTYLPQIGLYIAMTWLVAESWRVNRIVIGTVMALVLGALGICAWTQTLFWQDGEALWARALICARRGHTARSGNDGLVTIHYNLGNAFRQTGNIEDATGQYEEALQFDPDYAAAHVNLGSDLLATGKLDEAISHLQKALQLDSSLTAAHNDLGNAFLQKGNFAQAISQFQQAMRMEPADPWVKHNLAWILATCPQASLRDGAKAVDLARQADKLLGEENPIILHTLAAALAEAGQFSEAVKTARRALELAEAQSKPRLTADLQSEIALYESGKPYHASPAPP